MYFMNSSMFFTICSLFYSILLTVVYFSKKRLNVIENKIYASLIITNLVGIFTEIGCAIVGSLIPNNITISVIINKFYLIYLLTLFPMFDRIRTSCFYKSPSSWVHRLVFDFFCISTISLCT